MHSGDIYEYTVLILNGLGASSIAAALEPLLRSSRISFLHVYGLLLLAVVLWGAFIFDIRSLIGSCFSYMSAVPLGLLLGFLSTRADRTILKLLSKRQSIGPKHRFQNKTIRPIKTERLDIGIGGSSKVRQNIDNRSVLDPGYKLLSLLMIAILEEVFYRGWLLNIATMLPSSWLQSLAVAVSIGVFSLIHIRFGWEHVIAKLPLGIFALLGVLVTGSIFTAIIAHGWFNYRVWKDQLDTVGSSTWNF